MSDEHLLSDLHVNHRALQRDGSTIYSRASVEIESLRTQLAAAEAGLAVEKHENTRWEGVCDELEQQVNEARNTLRWVHRNIDRIRDWRPIHEGMLLVVDRIQDEIAKKVEVEE
jgi:hypothetical protein